MLTLIPVFLGELPDELFKSVRTSFRHQGNVQGLPRPAFSQVTKFCFTGCFRGRSPTGRGRQQGTKKPRGKRSRRALALLARAGLSRIPGPFHSFRYQRSFFLVGVKNPSPGLDTSQNIHPDETTSS